MRARTSTFRVLSVRGLPSRSLASRSPASRSLACGGLIVAAALLLLAPTSCSDGPGTDSESGFWLAPCDMNADCGSEYACVCGVCTWPCGPDDPCPEGRCRSTAAGPGGSVCASVPSPPEGICLLACGEAETCASTVATECSYGVCFPPEVAATLPAPRPVCTVAAQPAPGTLTEDFDADTDCECSAERPGCHSLYRAGVTSIDGARLTLELLKARNTGSAAPSSPIQWWLVATTDPVEPVCLDRESYPVLAEGVWAETTSLVTEVDLYAAEAFRVGVDDATWRLFFITGGGSLPDTKIFYQPEPLVLDVRCTDDE